MLQMIQEVWSVFSDSNHTDINLTVRGCYGDKETDTRAYLGSGLAPAAVHTVNTAGELKNVGTGQVSSYSDQVKIVDTLYPRFSHV